MLVVTDRYHTSCENNGTHITLVPGILYGVFVSQNSDKCCVICGTISGPIITTFESKL